MIELLNPHDAGVLLQETPRPPHWQALAELLAGRPTYDQIKVTPYEGARHEAARRAAFDPIVRDSAAEVQITRVYRLLHHIAGQLIDNPHEESNELYRHAEHRLETCSCLPAGGGISVGDGHHKWPSVRTSDGRARRNCRRFKTCPWCFYRRFLDLYDRITRSMKMVSAIEFMVEDPAITPRDVHRCLLQEMHRFTYPSAWWRAWPVLEDLQDDAHPMRVFLITDGPLQLYFPTRIPCIPIRLVDRVDATDFAQRYLPEIYRFDQYALPFRDYSSDALAYQRRVAGLKDALMVYSSGGLRRS